MARSKREPRVFFPWERKRGIWGAIGRARVRQVLLGAAVVALLVIVYRREEKAAAVRATRAAITNASRAIASYRADHGGSCPKAMQDLVTGGYARNVPVDAWGRQLRVTCPGRRDAQGFDVSSDGPDGVAGGLDRVE
jgi:general secretion pathway protein G